MEDEGAMLGVGFAIDFHDSFGRLKSLDDLIGVTQANAVREFQKIEAASRGAVSMGKATAEITAFGNAATREMASAAREIAQTEKAGEALVRQLDRQNAAFGKTREELRMMKAEAAAVAAEKNGLTELASRIRATESELAGRELAAARRARFAAEELAETKAVVEAKAAQQAAEERTRTERMLILQLGERAQLQAAIDRNTGTGRTRATDSGATFSALAAKAAQDEAVAANAASAAQKRLAAEHEHLAAMVRGSNAAMEADAAAAERMRSSTDPLYAATKRLNAEIAESTRLYHVGATAPAEYARQQQVLSGRLAATTVQHNEMAVAGGKNARAMGQVALQLPDIFQGLATGQKPMTVFIQQGGQLVQVAMMAEGGIKSMGLAVGRLALAFAPVIAIGAAAFGTMKLFQEQVKKDGDLTRYRDGLGLTHKEMLKLSDGVDKAGDKIAHLSGVTVTAGDIISGTWKAVADNAAKSGDWSNFSQGAVSAFKKVLDSWLVVSAGIDASIYGTFNIVKTVWSSFPAVFGDLFVQGVNAAIAALNRLVKAGVDQLNGLIASANKLPFVKLGTISAPQIGAIENANAGAAAKAAKEIGSSYSKAYAESRKADAAFWKQVGNNARQNAKDRMKEQADAIKESRTPKADKLSERLARESEATEALIAGLYKLADAYGVSDAAAMQAEVTAKAREQGIKKQADVDAYVEQQLRKATAERVAAGAKTAADLAFQTRAQTMVNEAVRAGTLDAENAGTALANLGQQRELMATINLAAANRDVQGYKAARRELTNLQNAQIAAAGAANNAKLLGNIASSNDRLAEMREELRLIGETDEARARSMATFKAQQELAGKTGLNPADAAAYVKLQGDIAVQALLNTQANDAYNASLTETADRWDIIAGKVQAAGQGMADAFGNAGRAIGDVASIFANYQAQRTRGEAYHDEQIKKAGKNEKLIAQENAQFALRTSGAQVGMFGDMASAAKGFFKEGSEGYKALAIAEKTFRAIEFALSARAMAQDAAETVASIAKSGARTAVKAVEAVVSAISSLPFPLNLVAGAATIGALASIGVAIAGSFGGSSKKPTSNDGNGTVLGDPSAKSESIKRSIDALKQVDTVMLTYSRQMAASLRSIESQIGGFAALVLRTGDVNANEGVNQGFKANGIGQTLGSIPLIGGILKGLFGTKTKVVGSGLFGGAQSLDSILGSGFDASYYSDVQKKKKFFGLTTSTKYSTTYAGADAGLENQFTLILKQFNDAILAAAGPLGESTDAIKSKLSGFIVDIGKIDLQGLTGAEIEEKLSAVFGAAADDMAKTAFPGIEKFQKVGEGLFETLVRVSSTVESVTASLGLLGSSAALMSNEVKVALADQFDSVGDFTSAIGGYFDAYYTKEEQAASRTAQFAKVFEGLGVAMPASLAGFRALVEAQNLTTAAGQATYATLLQLAPAFADLQSAMSGAKSAADILSEQQDLQRRLLELAGDTAALRALDLAKIDPSNRVLQQQVWAVEDAQKAAQAAEQLRDAWASVGDGIMEEVRRIRGLTTGSDEGSFATLLGQFNAATAAARGGDQDAAGKLVGLSQSLLKVAGDTATSRQELDRVQKQTAASLEATYGIISAITGASPGTSTSTLASAATAAQATSAPSANDDLATEVRALRDEVAALRADNNAGHAATAGNTGRLVRQISDVTAASGGEAITVASAA